MHPIVARQTKRSRWILAFLSLSVTQAVAQQPAPTRTVAVVDTFFGVAVADAYRWLENLDAPEVQAWFAAQGSFTRAWLDSLPGHAAILERLRQRDAAASPEISLPYEVDGRWFYTMRRPGDEVARGYVRDARTGEERMLVDPATVEGTGVAGANRLVTFVPSPDGRRMLYGIMTGGSETAMLRVRDIASGRDIAGPFRNQFNETAWWDPGGTAVYYWRPAEPRPDAPPGDLSHLYDISLVRHRLGTDAASDTVVMSGWSLIQLRSGDTLAIGRNVGENAWYSAAAADVTAGRPGWRPVFTPEDSVVSVIAHGSDLYVLTSRGTPRIVRTPRDAPDLRAADILLTGDTATTLQNMVSARDGIYVQWYSAGVNRLTRIPWGGRPESVELPGGMSIRPSDRYGSEVRVDPGRNGALVSLVSWTAAPRHFRFDPETGQFEALPLSPVGAMDRLTGYVTETLHAPSHDGVLVPLTIVRPEQFARDGSLPVMLEVYAAYGATDFRENTPGPWFDMGGAWAICHARGGGYYGETWHRAGRRSSKRNSWLDLIACAEHVVREGYTQPQRLVAGTGSAGGITLGRAITERPDLLGGAFISNGTLDAVRNAMTPVGRENSAEFGSLETEDGFRALFAMSPYHHVQPGTPYPAIMLWTGLGDTRVPAWESAKMAAALQAATSSDRPVLLRVQQAGGHISGALPAEEARLRNADMLAFWMAAAGLPPYRVPQDERR
jgi:prolyl oligopeptidase